MNKLLLSLFFFFYLSNSLLAQQSLVPISNNGQYSCLLTRASDQYGFYSASILQKLISGNYLNVDFVEQSTKLKNKIKKIRAAMKLLPVSKQSIRVVARRSKIRTLKTILTEIALCRDQKSQFYFDVGFGSDVDACDVVSGQQNFTSRIINGKECSTLNSPIVTLLLEDRNGDYYICSGTVVNSRSIITAAHCIDGIVNIIVQTGKGSIQAASFDYHPKYNGTETYDLGVVITNQDLNVPAFPVFSSFQSLTLGEDSIIAGFGVVNIGSEESAEVLMAGKNNLTRVASAGLSINFNTPDQSNTCFGDSGGPLLVYRNSRWVLAGVTSNGQREDCGYEDVSNFASLQNVANRSYLSSRISGLID